MAQPLRKVWLEPEEEGDAGMLRVAPRRRHPFAGWLRLLINVAVVVCMVGGVVLYINAQARIAKLEMERQQLQREAARLAREQTQLCLQLDRFSAPPRLAALAQAQGLQLPEAAQIEVLHLAEAPPGTAVAAAPAPSPDTWIAHSARLLAALLHDALARVNRGPGNVAYAQD